MKATKCLVFILSVPLLVFASKPLGIVALSHAASPPTNGSIVVHDIDPRGPCKADVLALCSQYLKDDVKKALLAVKSGSSKAGGSAPPAASNATEATQAAASARTSGATTNGTQSTARQLLAATPVASPAISPWLNVSKLAFKATREFAQRHGDLLKHFQLAPDVLDDSVLLHRTPLARCLTNAIRQAKLSISPVVHHVSEACKADVRAVFARKASDIRHDLPLLVLCAEDVKAFCRDVPSASVQGCLREAKARLAPKCADAVTARLIDSAEDISLDADLNKACGKDRERLCAEKGWGGGAALKCLEKETWQPSNATAPVSEECKDAIFKRRVHDSEDIRFNYGLSIMCAADKAKYCGSVLPGKARVITCLEDHRLEPEFNPRCRRVLERMMMARALDARLDYGLRTTCLSDVLKLCPEYAPMLTDPFAKATGGDRIYECLRSHMHTLASSECKVVVHKHVARGFKDNRMDAGLLRACHQDIDRHCERAESALTCLRHVLKTNSTAIASNCKDMVMARSQVAFDDIAFHTGIATACAYDLKRFCEGTPTRGGAAMQCLQDHMHSLEFHALCHREVEKYLMESVEDIRLISGLREACQPSIDELCSDVEPGQGRVIYCLQSRRKDIASGACRNQLLRLLGLAAEDYRMDYILYKACQDDANTFCEGVDPRGGHVNACLRQHEDRLSKACKHMQERLEQIEHEEIRVNVKLRKACGGALSMYCKDVDTKDAQQLLCLQQHHQTAHDFPSECHKVLTELRDRQSTRLHLNPRLKLACAGDASKLCYKHFGEDGSAASNEESVSVMQCLADQALISSQPCRREIVQAVRYQMNAYRIGMPLTSPCDGDAMQWCHADSVSTPLVEQGFISECLTQHAINLTRTCWSIISLGDPAQMTHASKVESTHYNERISQEMLSQILADVNEKLSAREQQLLERVDSTLSDKVKGHVEESVRGSRSFTSNFFLLLLAVGGAAALVSLVIQLRKKTLVIKDGRA